jgi:hypothetical protein
LKQQSIKNPEFSVSENSGFFYAENQLRDFVKNNLPRLIGFYPILNDITLSGFQMFLAKKGNFLPYLRTKALKGRHHLG